MAKFREGDGIVTVNGGGEVTLVDCRLGAAEFFRGGGDDTVGNGYPSCFELRAGDLGGIAYASSVVLRAGDLGCTVGGLFGIGYIGGGLGLVEISGLNLTLVVCGLPGGLGTVDPGDVGVRGVCVELPVVFALGLEAVLGFWLSR